MKIGAKLLKLLSFKDLLSNTFSVSFIRQYTQLVPGGFNAACVSYMETVGVFDPHVGHVRYGLKLEFQGSNFSPHTRKMRVKKAISEVVFCLLAFSREWKFGAVIRGSYHKCISSLQFP